MNRSLDAAAVVVGAAVDLASTGPVGAVIGWGLIAVGCARPLLAAVRCERDGRFLRRHGIDPESIA